MAHNLAKRSGLEGQHFDTLRRFLTTSKLKGTQFALAHIHGWRDCFLYFSVPPLKWLRRPCKTKIIRARQS